MSKEFIFEKASEEVLALRSDDARGLPGWEKKVLRKVMHWILYYEAFMYDQHQ